jgi:transposase-like protein
MLLRHFPRKVLNLRRPKRVFLEESAESQAKGETVSALARRHGLIPQQLS